MGPPPAGLGGGNEGPQAGKQGQQGDPAAAQRFFKTRLCNKFMNTGSCQYGETCKYAHGPSDIRQPNSLAGSEGQGGGHFQGQFPAPMQARATAQVPALHQAFVSLTFDLIGCSCFLA